MTGFIVKKYSTVVMDGSDMEVISFITGLISLITRGRHGGVTCRPLDDEHPTMMVIETRTTKNTYDVIEEMLTEYYPGLCVFNPPMSII